MNIWSHRLSQDEVMTLEGEAVREDHLSLRVGFPGAFTSVPIIKIGLVTASLPHSALSLPPPPLPPPLPSPLPNPTAR